MTLAIETDYNDDDDGGFAVVDLPVDSDNLKKVLHVSILQANEVGQPEGDGEEDGDTKYDQKIKRLLG